MSAELEKLKPIPLEPLPDNPLVSILMPNYNYGKYIGEAIESVLQQTYSNWELIICDDGSTDDSCEVVRRYQSRDYRIKLIQKENGGMASALNAAFYASRGEVICLLDADDWFTADKIKIIVEELRISTNVGLVIHPLWLVNARGELLRPLPIPRRLQQGWLGPLVLQNWGIWACPPASGLSFRASAVRPLLPIPLLFKKNADGYLSTGLAMLTEVRAVSGVLAYYRIHGHNITGVGWASPNQIDYMLKLRRDFFVQITEKLDMRIPSEKMYDSPVFAEALILYRLQTGQHHPFSRKSIWQLLSNVQGVRRWVYLIMLVFIPPIRKYLIRLWHTNYTLKRILDAVRRLVGQSGVSIGNA